MAKSQKPSLVCPYNCGGRTYKTLNTGRVTRCCGEPVVTVNHQIYKELNDAPEWVLMQYFVHHKKKTLPYYEIEYGTKDYQESVRAARMLYEKCGKDMGISQAAIDVAFEHEAHSWRTYSALQAVLHHKWWAGIRALAMMQVVRQRKERELQAQYVRSHHDSGLEAAYVAARSAV